MAFCVTLEQEVEVFSCSSWAQSPGWAVRPTASPPNVACPFGVVIWFIFDVSILLEVTQVTEACFCSTFLTVLALFQLTGSVNSANKNSSVFQSLAFSEFSCTSCHVSRHWPFCKIETLPIQVG